MPEPSPEIMISQQGYLLVEFGNELLIDTEDHEATVLGPCGSLAFIALVSDKDNSEIAQN